MYSVLLIYYHNSWSQIPMVNEGEAKNNGEKKDGIPFLSVIIAARNEERNIVSCLQSLTEQDFPSNLFEVIIVDDFSTDDTAAKVNSFKDNNILLLSLKGELGDKKINSYKKKGIEAAISKARGELIVTTDADCIVPQGWLKTILSFYEKTGASFIAAPVAFYGEVNFLQIFQSLDFMALQGITGAGIYKKFHSMSNGANQAYLKSAFNEVGGFTNIDNIASGDDMLLMHKIAMAYPDRIYYLKSKAAIVQTKPAATLKEFFNQRIRWASKADKYADTRITIVLLLVYLLNLWIAMLFIFSFFFPGLFSLGLGLLIGKTITELYFLYPVAVFFGKKKLLWWFPVAQPFHIIYIIVAGWLGKFGSYTWKNRKVN
jgi:cellulose synthase/poly-beta-1,6-N-acetylglucosamine synthase-like glycosyltransferase